MSETSMLLYQKSISLSNLSDLLKFTHLSLISIGPLYCLKVWSNQGELFFWVLELELLTSKHYNANFDHLLLWGGGGGAL